jgi:hypothetical protein
MPIIVPIPNASAVVFIFYLLKLLETKNQFTSLLRQFPLTTPRCPGYADNHPSSQGESSHGTSRISESSNLGFRSGHSHINRHIGIQNIIFRIAFNFIIKRTCRPSERCGKATTRSKQETCRNPINIDTPVDIFPKP